MKKLTIEIEDEQHQALKIYCATNKTEMTAVIRRLLGRELGPKTKTKGAKKK